MVVATFPVSWVLGKAFQSSSEDSGTASQAMIRMSTCRLPPAGSGALGRSAAMP